MKINLNNLDSEDIEIEQFQKIKSKKRKLKGKQSVKQLVSQAQNPSDPDAKFENHDLNELSRLGFLDELISDIKTGKEAAVYLGRNSADGFVAVKVYTDLRVRSFRRDDSYRQGRYIGDERIEKAIEHGSRTGLDAHQILWVQEEFRQMKYLREHGVSVPRAIAASGITLVMEFIGDEEGNAAPRIADLKMKKDEAEEAFGQSVQNLKLIVKSGRVHGDYSAFNILWHDEKAIVIDFPQVVEFTNNENALDFLERDVRSLCKSFRKQGVRADEAKVLKEIR
ncbi:MAG TPA: RIO1 family regulatory kinase/ATPase [Pyrinomonadaceae bacterium]|nr:RIO1 family regulatory kinase/ATPase [Pyrinomonadaceae bacterium]